MFFTRSFVAAALCAVVGTSATSLVAHEFWIEPQKFQAEIDETVEIDLKNGQNFVGTTLSYFDSQIARFEVVVGGKINSVTGRAGDNPALATQFDQNGLVVLLHETTPNTLEYKEWEKFAKFADHKDFPNAEADHMAAGWPRVGFRESYTRHVKSLIAIGDGAGRDQNFGLKTEFVAHTNPYAPDFDGIMRVEVLLENAPRTNAQVEVFERAPDEIVNITLHHTDANGIAEIPVKPNHDYLFDAVVLRPHTVDDKAVWQTLWAALTFHVPD